MKRSKAFTVRLDLNNEQEKQTWEYFMEMDRQKYRSYSQLISEAVNEFFSKSPESALIGELKATIREELGKIQIVNVQKPVEMIQGNAEELEEDEISTALDFADSF